MKFKLLGFRSKKTWKMVLAGFTYAFILMVVMIGILSPSSEEEVSGEAETEKIVEVVKPVEKEETKVVAKEVIAKEKEEVKVDPVEDKVNVEKEYYMNNTKIEVDRINSEYDEIWNQHWKPAWELASKGDMSNLNSDMEMTVQRYDTLYTAISNIPTDQLTIGKQNIEEYKLSLGKAILYRKNAAQSILQALNGTADLDSRMEESKKSIELSDEYLYKGIAEIAQLQIDLNIE